ncbi:MAG: AzlC family ABC transporter permease [Coriobacteriia bacterium]|nr:AzlC family ABC transporter permease [Coriobacteriia bacterium]
MRGVRLGFPVFLGYMPVGMAFGVIATTVGFSVVQATICSATALAGAGQFIALSLMRAGEGVVAVVAATTIVNLRYVLFGATLSPHLRRTSVAGQAVLAFTLTDETFAINITDRRSGLSTAMSMAGVGGVAWAGWVGGTVIGASAAAWIGDPSRFGVDFAMPAMFTALFIALAEDRRHVVIGIVAAAVAITLPALASLGLEVPTSWFIVVATTVAATAGAVLFRE